MLEKTSNRESSNEQVIIGIDLLVNELEEEYRQIVGEDDN